MLTFIILLILLRTLLAEMVKLAFALHKPAAPSAARFTVVAMHGFLGSKRNFISIGASLAASNAPVPCNTLALDLRNHEGSPHTSTHDLPGMAADLKELLDTGDVLPTKEQPQALAEEVRELIRSPHSPPIVLMADSMGGMAQYYHLWHHHRKCHSESLATSKVVASIGIDIAPAPRPPSFYRMFDFVKTMQEMPLTDELLAAALKHSPTTKVHKASSTTGVVGSTDEAELWLRLALDEEPDPWFCKYLVSMLEPVADGSKLPGQPIVKTKSGKERKLFYWKSNLPVLAHCASSCLWREALPLKDDPKIQIPSRFIFGEDSPYYTQQATDAIRSYFGHPSIECVPKAGHFLHIQKRQQFMESVNAFLKNL